MMVVRFFLIPFRNYVKADFIWLLQSSKLSSIEEFVGL